VLWVQSPTGMPATHGSCVIGSGGTSRTFVCTDSETGRDTDNPHLSSLAGRQGLEPCQARFWRPATAPAGCPKLAERTALEADTREGTRRLPTGPRSLAGLRSNMADGGSLEDHVIADTHCFRGRSSTLAGSPSNIWRMRSESNGHPFRADTAFKAGEHATCAHPSWRRALRPRQMPFRARSV
jgi:hypothetical protein